MTEPAPRWAGDFLLLFNPPSTLPRARMGASWALEYQQPGSSLYISAPSKNWRGAPLSQWQEGNRLYWLFGELWGARDNLAPADWRGHFALLALDQETSHWHLWTDRCGTFHVYYGSGDGSAALGSFSPAVAALTPRTLDVEALAGFFSFGFFAAERTHYKEVQIIRPAAHLVIDDSGHITLQERTWQWRYQPDPRRSFDQAVDEFAGLFHQVIRDQAAGRSVAFPISGGLDSRSTIAALPAAAEDSQHWCYSYGFSPDSVETRIAGKIAAARRLPYQAYTVAPYLFDALPMVMDSVEGFQDITQARQAFVADDLAAHADYVMAAHWGDVWLDDMGLKDHPSVNFLEFAASKFHKSADWLTRHIIQPLAPKLDVPAFLRETLHAETQRLGQIDDADFRLKALKTELWSFRWTTASLRMYQPGAFPLLPFYDPRLVDFSCTVPTDYVAGRRLQVDYLKRYAPDLARIPWQVYDANLYWYRWFNSLLLPKRALKKFARKVRGKPILQRNWEVQFLSPGGRENLERSLLTDGLKAHTLVSREDINALLRAFYAAPAPAEAYSLSMLLTFSAWLEANG